MFSFQISFLSSRACPGGFSDPEELLPMCYKCSNYSSHLRGNQCPTCQTNYLFSFVSFGEITIKTIRLRKLTEKDCFVAEILPIVEFMPEPDIPGVEVERLLMAPPKSDAKISDPFGETIGQR